MRIVKRAFKPWFTLKKPSHKLRIPGTIARDLGVMIVSGMLRPGMVLEGEVEASDQRKVSRSAYREAKSQRADLVARELAIAGFNAGVVAAAPPGTSVRWVTDPVRGCSPDCQDNSLAGPIPAGQSFPTGSPYPPAHQRCRCLVIPDRQ